MHVMLGAYEAAHPARTTPQPAANASKPALVPRGHGAAKATKDSMQPHDQSNEALADGVWPDPDLLPSPGGNHLSVDDVSRMNTTPVERIFFVRTKQDVQAVLKEARLQKKPVSVRGTKHSMGGHTIARHGFVIDMASILN